MRVILNVLGFVVSLALFPLFMAVVGVVFYTVVYCALWITPFACLGHFVYRRLTR